MESDPTLALRISDQPRSYARCPACRREFVWQENPYRPFCSLTCRLIDLGVWLDEGYRISGGETAAEPAPEHCMPDSGA